MQSINDLQRFSYWKCLSRKWFVFFVILQMCFVQVIWAKEIVTKEVTQDNKACMIDLIKQVDKNIKENRPGAAIAMLEEYLVGYVVPQKITPEETQLLIKIHYGLAVAKISAGASYEEQIDAYKQFLQRCPYYFTEDHLRCLVWLKEKITTKEFNELLSFLKMGNRTSIESDIQGVIQSIMNEGNVSFLSQNMDLILDIGAKSVDLLRKIDQIIKKNKELEDRLIQYCKKKPIFAPYISEKNSDVSAIPLKKDPHLVLYEDLSHLSIPDNIRDQIQMIILPQVAEKYYEIENYKRAAKCYSDLAKQTILNADMTLKMCRCLYNLGEDEKVMYELNKFLTQYRKQKTPVVDSLIFQALILKGMCYIQKKDSNNALATFRQLIVDYPKSIHIPDFIFMMGYCQMHRGQIKEAQYTFMQMVELFPYSSFTDEAKLLLKHMKQLDE